MPHLNLHSRFAPASLALAGIVTAFALLAAPAAQAQPYQPGWHDGPGPGMMPPPPPPGSYPGDRGPGYGGPGYGYGGPGRDRGPIVRCESDDGRYRECRKPFHGPVVLVRQLSDARCIYGRSYGTSRPGFVWVDRGCRADFGPR